MPDAALSGRDVLLWPITEPQWRDQVVTWAERAGYMAYWTWSSIHSPAGFPDLVLAKPGRPLIFAELKTMRGKLTLAQRLWLNLLDQVPGILCFVWRPSDDKQIKEVLGLDRRRG